MPRPLATWKRNSPAGVVPGTGVGTDQGSGGGGGGGASDTAAQIRDKLQTLQGVSRLDATAIKNLPSGGGSGTGLTQAQRNTLHDVLLARGLSITDKVMFWSNNGGDFSNSYDLEEQLGTSARDIRNKLQGLIGVNRLDASAVKDIDEEITGAQVVAKLSALSGSARLPASAVRDLPTGGAGLTAAGVRAQIAAALVGGTNVTITPSGSGASQRFTIAATAGSGGGLTQSAVDARANARIGALVQPFAINGRADLVPPAKVGPVGTATNLTNHLNGLGVRLSELEEFENSLRHTETVVSPVNVRIAFSNFAQYVITGAMLPSASEDAELTITIGVEGTYTFNLSALRAKSPVSNAATLSSSNSVGFVLGTTQYYLAWRSNRQLVIGSNNVGTRRISIIVRRLPPQLPHPTVANRIVGVNAAGEIVYQSPSTTPTTDIDNRIAYWARASNADVIPQAKAPIPAQVAVVQSESATFTSQSFTDSRSGRSLSVIITVDTRVYTLTRIDQAISDGDVEVFITVPSGTTEATALADFEDYWLWLNDHRLSFKSGSSLGISANQFRMEWPAQPANTIKVGTNTLEIYEPTDPDRDFIPRGGASGQYVTRKDTGEAEWQTLPEQASVGGARTVHTGAITGITVTNVTRDVTNQLASFVPDFVLTNERRNGIFTYELTLTRATTSDNRLLLGNSTSARISGDTFASVVAAKDAFNISGGVGVGEAEEIARQPVMWVGNKEGDIILYLVRTSANVLGYVLAYKQSSSLRSTNFSVSASLSLSFTPHDVGQVTAVDSHFFKVAEMPMPTGTNFTNRRGVGLDWNITGNATGHAYTTNGSWLLQEPGGLPLNVLGYKATLERAGNLLVHGFAPIGPSPSGGTSETVSLKDAATSGFPIVAVAWQRLPSGSAYTRIFISSINSGRNGFPSGTTLVIYQVRL